MKKFLSILLALVIVLSLATVAFADGEEQTETPEKKTSQDAFFTKTYKITNAGTGNPEETFTFAFTADRVTDSNKNLQKSDMPSISSATVTFDANSATTAGLQKTVNVALSSVNWPGVGVYYYKVNETAGTTAGVNYDNAEAWLKITVAYDNGSNTYYTAFVTLSLTDGNNDGITDSKTCGFTNEYQAGSLAITKNVTGNMGDPTAYFAVKVKLNGETGKTYATSYNVTGGSHESNPSTIAIGTETTFYLKKDETITISNLPYGVTYTVVEEDYTSADKGGYDVADYNFSDKEKKIDSASDTVTITNNKGVVVDTGITLDSMPYFVMLSVACIGMFLLLTKKRSAREF